MNSKGLLEAGILLNRNQRPQLYKQNKWLPQPHKTLDVKPGPTTPRVTFLPVLSEKRTGSARGEAGTTSSSGALIGWKRYNLEKVPPCPTSAQLHLQSWTVDLSRTPSFGFSAAQEMPGGGRCPECGSAELVEDSHYSQNQLVCSDCGCVVTEGVLTTTYTDEGNLRGIFWGGLAGPWRLAGEARVVHAGRWRWRKKLKVFLGVLGGEHSWRGSGDQICAHLVDVDLPSTRPAWLPARTR